MISRQVQEERIKSAGAWELEIAGVLTSSQRPVGIKVLASAQTPVNIGVLAGALRPVSKEKLADAKKSANVKETIVIYYKHEY